MTTETYAVNRMTYTHCARAVSDEISAVAGVTAVSVDLTTGKAAVSCDKPVIVAKIRLAVEEAGYSLAS